MVFSLRATLVACVTSIAYASPILEQRTASFGPPSIKEQVNIPAAWSATGSPHPDTVLNMHIALKQNNIDGLEQKLLDISNPKSPNYGKWLSKEDMESYTRPSEESVGSVKQWLSSHGIQESSISQPSPDWIKVKVPISKAESMLDSKYSLFRSSVSGTEVPRTTAYSIPLSLHDHVDTIQPTTSFHRSMGAQAARDSAETQSSISTACDPNNIVPSCIQSYYNVDYTSKGRASLAVTGLIDYSASHLDAAQFLRTYDSSIAGTDFADASINGAKNQPNNATLEGNLDTQVALALGYPNPVTYYAVGPNYDPGTQFGDELVDLGLFLNSATNPPTSVSTSYGGEEQGFSSDYLDRICNEFMKAGSRGISIFFSSGDFGVGGMGESSCSGGFYALFPASCPYVTAVGSTQFSNGGEQAAIFEHGGSTGGGFSWHFAAPSYQSADTKSYISSNLDSSFNGYYKDSGRGYPDVALVGEYYDIIINGSTIRAYGTSASSPAWAALISQINDYRINEGKSTLGFLNPLIYGSTTVRATFNDITVGNNRGCDSNGFPAAAGWDPTTGLGTMNFGKLRQALG